MVLPNSAQKWINLFVVKLPAMHCSCYELEISWEKILGYTVLKQN